jgi:hypothetical protein
MIPLVVEHHADRELANLVRIWSIPSSSWLQSLKKRSLRQTRRGSGIPVVRDRHHGPHRLHSSGSLSETDQVVEDGAAMMR